MALLPNKVPFGGTRRWGVPMDSLGTQFIPSLPLQSFPTEHFTNDPPNDRVTPETMCLAPAVFPFLTFFLGSQFSVACPLKNDRPYSKATQRPC